jgi:hypothetical protein
MTLGSSPKKVSFNTLKKQFPPCENVRLAASLYHKPGNSAPGGPFTACLPRVITLDDLPGAPLDHKAGRTGLRLPKLSRGLRACPIRPPFNLPVAKAGVTPCQTGRISGAASLEGEVAPEHTASPLAWCPIEARWRSCRGCKQPGCPYKGSISTETVYGPSPLAAMAKIWRFCRDFL